MSNMIAEATAKILLDTESVLFNAKEPFVFTSGRVSPVYVDIRRLIGFTEERSKLMEFATDLLRDNIGDDQLDVLAGGETAGIPYAAFLAERMNKPMVYVRKKPKGFGRMAQIEGYLEDQKKVILIEDLQTDGGSKKVFIDALRDAGAIVEHSFVIFHYGILAASTENNKKMGVTLHALATWWDVLNVAKELQYFDTDTLSEVEKFLHDPDGWATQNAHRAKVS